jgi:MFS family permease
VGRILSGLSAGIFTGTATATLVDLAPPDGRGRATLVATIANMGGLGAGPLLAGLLAQWASSPLRVIFYVDLALLAVASIGVWAMPEPVSMKPHPRLRLQALTVPREIRATFVSAALAGFAGFAVLGLFTAVAPAFLGQQLGVTSSAVVGLVVSAVFAGSLLGQAMVQRMPEGAAMPAGCLALIVGMAGVALGLALPALVPLVVGGVIAGVGHGLSFRAGLGAVNAGAPAEQRGAAASSFFVVMYLAISVPVIGVGVLAQSTGLREAGLIFAAAVAALAAGVLVLLSVRHVAPAAASPCPARRQLPTPGWSRGRHRPAA